MKGKLIIPRGYERTAPGRYENLCLLTAIVKRNARGEGWQLVDLHKGESVMHSYGTLRDAFFHNGGAK